MARCVVCFENNNIANDEFHLAAAVHTAKACFADFIVFDSDSPHNNKHSAIYASCLYHLRHKQRLPSGTRDMTESLCMPQPPQVVLPHLLQFTAKHIFSSCCFVCLLKRLFYYFVVFTLACFLFMLGLNLFEGSRAVYYLQSLLYKTLLFSLKRAVCSRVSIHV